MSFLSAMFANGFGYGLATLLAIKPYASGWLTHTFG
jgi:hypothetical protein